MSVLSFFGMFTIMAALPVLANPTFLTGANDATAVADIYNLTNPGVITNVENFLETLGDDVLSLLIGSAEAALGLPLLSLIEDVSTITGATVNAGSSTTATAGTVASTSSTTTAATTAASSAATVAANQAALVSRLVSSSSAINSAVRNMSTTGQANMVSGLSSDTSTATNFSVTLGTVTSTIASTNYSDIAQVSALINAFTGTNAAALAVDTTAIAAIISGVVTECISLGVANAWASVTQAITDATVLLTAAKQCLSAVVTAGDLTSLEAMAASLSASTIRQISTTALSSYVSSFESSFYTMLGLTAAEAAAALSAITAAFTAVDASWNVASRSGSASTVTDVTDLTGGSSGFIDVITRGVLQSPATDASPVANVMATLEGDMTVIEELEAVYPTVTLTTGAALVIATSPPLTA